MERSAIYRRALAPVMAAAGVIGLAGSIIPCFVSLKTNLAFGCFWMAISILTLAVSLFLVRRQAIHEKEPFWSPPTRRVTSALLPAFFLGLVAGAMFLVPGLVPEGAAWLLAPTWLACYGSGIHAAGFFMKRGMKLLGWAFICGGCGAFILFALTPQLRTVEAAHYLMGIFFGIVHALAGAYLWFTERRRKAG